MCCLHFKAICRFSDMAWVNPNNDFGVALSLFAMKVTEDWAEQLTRRSCSGTGDYLSGRSKDSTSVTRDPHPEAQLINYAEHIVVDCFLR